MNGIMYLYLACLLTRSVAVIRPPETQQDQVPERGQVHTARNSDSLFSRRDARLAQGTSQLCICPVQAICDYIHSEPLPVAVIKPQRLACMLLEESWVESRQHDRHR